MAISTRVDPIDRDIALFLQETLSPQAQSRVLASYAREQLAETQQINRQALGSVPPHESFVDGAGSARFESVRPDGVIVIEFRLLGDAVRWVEEQLVKHSPKGAGGRYSRSHVLFADGAEVSPDSIPENVVSLTFVNDQPYSRKIERGLSNQAPDGVYEVVSVLAARRFGNVAKFRFTYISLQGGAIHDWASKTSMTREGRNMKASQRAEWLRRQPAIVITV